MPNTRGLRLTLPLALLLLTGCETMTPNDFKDHTPEAEVNGTRGYGYNLNYAPATSPRRDAGPLSPSLPYGQNRIAIYEYQASAPNPQSSRPETTPGHMYFFCPSSLVTLVKFQR
jgi:hypothetical protein